MVYRPAGHPDPFLEAERAAFAAFGALPDAVTIERLRNALTAHRTTLAAAGLLRDDTAVTPHSAVVAAKFLAEQSRFPRYEGDGWELLLTSAVDVDVAYRKAVAHATEGETAHTKDLANARRVLFTIIGQTGEATPQGDFSTTRNPGDLR